MGRGKGALGKGCKLIFIFFIFLLVRGRGVEVNVFFLPSFDMEGGRERDVFFFLILFFHCGVARDRGSNFGIWCS